MQNPIELETIRFSTWQKLQQAGLLLLNPEYVERAIRWGHSHRELSAQIVCHIQDDLR